MLLFFFSLFFFSFFERSENFNTAADPLLTKQQCLFRCGPELEQESIPQVLFFSPIRKQGVLSTLYQQQQQQQKIYKET